MKILFNVTLLNFKKLTSILITVILSVSITNCSDKNTSEGVVNSFGNRQLIINENNLKATVRLDTLLTGKGNYALGPVEGLQGEITVYDGVVSISKVQNGRPEVNSDVNTNAIFLIMANTNNWQKISIDKTLNGLDEIETYIRETAMKQQIDIDRAFPFKIESKVPSLDYHIIYKMNDAPHNMVEHKKAKQKFKLENKPIDIIGFWVDKNRVGKLTHPGKRTHLHFMAKNNSTSGHIDNVTISMGSELFLPSF